MAGGAQGGGARPAVGQPQFNPQAAQQFQQALQNYRQGSMGMPSQMPGANVAVPGGGMAASGGMPQQALPSGFGGPMKQQPAPYNPQQFPGLGASSVMPQQQPMQQQRPQIKGNPTAMPLQKPQTREQQVYQQYMRGRGRR